MRFLMPGAESPTVGLTLWFISKRIVLLVLLIAANTGILRGQQIDSGNGVDKQTIQALLQRIERLEAANGQLQERVTQLEKAQHGPIQDFATQSSVPAGAQPALGSTAQAAAQGGGSVATPAGSQGEATAPERIDPNRTLLNIRGFGDFSLNGGNQKGTTTSFSLGQFDFFITSNISDRFRFVTDLVFEKGVGNDFEEDLERVLLEYTHSDYLKLEFGRDHTAIGYYNLAFGHSSWWQTATRRPYLFLFEDEGGILPGHIVGASASGEIPSGKLGLHYIAEVGNGRASTPGAEPVQNFIDENNNKAVDLNVFLRPESIPGLQVGSSVYRDFLSPPNSPKIGETILDTYVALERSKFEWLNEGLLIRHTPVGSSHVFNTSGFYTQISKGFGSWKPYFRYQYANAPNNEPVFFPLYNVSVGLQYGPSVGVRYDFAESVAAKLQYDYTDVRRVQGITQQSISQLALQLTFAF